MKKRRSDCESGWEHPLGETFLSSNICGGYSGEDPPLPIPNREVKLTHADGTDPPVGRVGSCGSSSPWLSDDSRGLFFVYVPRFRDGPAPCVFLPLRPVVKSLDVATPPYPGKPGTSSNKLRHPPGDRSFPPARRCRKPNSAGPPRTLGIIKKMCGTGRSAQFSSFLADNCVKAGLGHNYPGFLVRSGP